MENVATSNTKFDHELSNNTKRICVLRVSVPKKSDQVLKFAFFLEKNAFKYQKSAKKLPAVNSRVLGLSLEVSVVKQFSCLFDSL